MVKNQLNQIQQQVMSHIMQYQANIMSQFQQVNLNKIRLLAGQIFSHNRNYILNYLYAFRDVRLKNITNVDSIQLAMPNQDFLQEEQLLIFLTYL